MKLAMISCEAYSDAWPGFFGLLEKFWPDHPKVTILTDKVPNYFYFNVHTTGFSVATGSWCEILAKYSAEQTEPFILMQEDLFLTANVHTELIAAAAAQLGPNIGGVRLYPCPGGAIPLGSDARIGIAGSHYRISCMATIWSPAFLVDLLEAIGPGSAAHFELEGSKYPKKIMLAWMRESKPWPIEYLCSAISRGLWNPDAKKLCDANSITVDWSKRPMQEAITP